MNHRQLRPSLAEPPLERNLDLRFMKNEMLDTQGQSVQEGGLKKISLAKRLFDILFSGVAIIMLAPLMAVIAVLIKIGSKGPVLFKQHRNGLNGKVFEVWKFRSMSVLENGSV